MDDYGFPDEQEIDYAALVSELERKLDRRKLAPLLGIRERELDLIRIGHPPSKEAAERLRLLRDLRRQTEHSDPEALAAALIGARRDVPSAYLAVFRRPWLLLAIFLAVDAFVVVLVLAYFLIARG